MMGLDNPFFQVNEEEKCVKIEYIIDDSQNYGLFLI